MRERGEREEQNNSYLWVEKNERNKKNKIAFNYESNDDRSEGERGLLFHFLFEFEFPFF